MTLRRTAWRLLLVLLVAAAAYLARMGSQTFGDEPSPPTTTCTTFANGAGGGWVCEGP